MSEPFTPQRGPFESEPSFLARVFLMPFSPSLWRGAVGTGTFKIVAALAALSLLLGLALGVWFSIDFKVWMHEQAARYDEQLDPIVYEGGRLRVEGNRIVHIDEGDMTLLIDPAGTVPTEEVTTSQYVIVREYEMVQKGQFGPEQTVPLSELEPLLGSGPVVIDGEHLSGFIDDWGTTLQGLTVVVIVIITLLVDLVTCLIYAAFAASIILPVRGRASGLGYAACFRVALAASAATLVMNLALHVI
ncbi:MAG: DUF1189 domain-containing protein, partial [Acidobacteriota bacterium]|nr:DUF1189 domain-containing protein [Acidobacteriota bacterium]